MKKSQKILLIIIIVTIAAIWGQSLLNRTASSAESGFVLAIVGPAFRLIVKPEHLTMLLIRKLAHFTEFFVLGVELELFLKKKFLWAAGTGFFVAFMDETLQMFSGREAMISDVWLDFFGCITAIAVVILLLRLTRKKKNDQN